MSHDTGEGIVLCAYVVTDPGDTPLVKKQILSEAEYREYRDKYGAIFKPHAETKLLLEEIDLEQMSAELRQELKDVSGKEKFALKTAGSCRGFS